MPNGTTLWTTSQKRASSFVDSGVARGLTATEALAQYRSGGGAIRDSYWYSMFRESFAQIGVRDNIKAIPYTYTVPDQMFVIKDFDFREKYVMQMEVRGFSEDLGEWMTTWVTVESDVLLTKNEWRSFGEQALAGILGSLPLSNLSVLQWNPIKRMREGIDW